ncbi:MAG TPA: N-acetylmuramoyl-L-alanine amidase [Holophagaceae bacterium]|nr:N-acetylmuramoyl-L-alanine amidase [Holophagaceae bacterium]
MGAFRPALLLVPALLCAQEPATQEREAVLPTGETAKVRLQFRKGVFVEGPLPKAFVGKPRKGVLAYDELTPEGRRWVLAALFPKDRWTESEVRHRVHFPELESVWLMASLFTGHGQNYGRLMRENPDQPEKLAEGDLWRIPRSLLWEGFGGDTKGADRSQPEDELDDESRVAAYRGMLSFERDAKGPYAAYHLRKGEALYSSVVIRYTDRVDPKDVNELAAVIAVRSGIADVRSIQPGTLVKIPLEALADPFQPEGTKALEEEREVRAEVRRTVRTEAGPRLGGVRIVLDAGHGGVDNGAMANDLWEADFVYDIMIRVRRLLEQETEASVSSTIRYPSLGFKAREVIRRPLRDAEILTTPPFPNDGDSPTAVSVHLRWVLSNQMISDFVKRKGDFAKTLFISFHADSLHPSAKGSMVYVPGSIQVPTRFTLSPKRSAHVQEMKHGGQVSFTAREKLQGEARSRQFAEVLMRSLQKARIGVHPNRPIRNVIHRDGKKFVPAVICYNRASAKVLVEVANLTNEQDAANLRDPEFRERYAVAVVSAIKAYYRK